jgi:CheY-like chemotaxis protein
MALFGIDAPTLSGLRVLVVDDDIDTLDITSALLRRCGASVDTAASVAEAMPLVTTAKPHVVVADVAMPGQDGFALLAKLRALAPQAGGQTPTVALTAYRALGDAPLVGFDRSLTKPAEPAVLVRTVAALARPVDIALHVDGTQEEASARAQANLGAVLQGFDPTTVRVVVFDVSREGLQAEADGVVYTPCLVKRHPLPRAHVVGDLKDRAAVEDVLENWGVLRLR